MNPLLKGVVSLFDWFPKKEFKRGTFQDDYEALKSDWDKVLKQPDNRKSYEQRSI